MSALNNPTTTRIDFLRYFTCQMIGIVIKGVKKIRPLITFANTSNFT